MMILGADLVPVDLTGLVVLVVDLIEVVRVALRVARAPRALVADQRFLASFSLTI